MVRGGWGGDSPTVLRNKWGVQTHAREEGEEEEEEEEGVLTRLRLLRLGQ